MQTHRTLKNGGKYLKLPRDISRTGSPKVGLPVVRIYLSSPDLSAHFIYNFESKTQGELTLVYRFGRTKLKI